MKNSKILILLLLTIGSVMGCVSLLQDFGGEREAVSAQTNIINNTKSKQTGAIPYFLDYQIDATLDGEALGAVASALESFKSDTQIEKEKKDLSKYTLELRQDDEKFFIVITPKGDPGKAYFGGDIVYSVSKQDGSLQRAFSK